MTDLKVREHCPCGSEFEMVGPVPIVRDQLAQFRVKHTGHAPGPSKVSPPWQAWSTYSSTLSATIREGASKIEKEVRELIKDVEASFEDRKKSPPSS